MSYILDALKKSEEQRGAGLASTLKPVAFPTHPSGQRRFVWPLMFVLAAFMLIAGWFLPQWQASDPKPALKKPVASPSISSPSIASPSITNQSAGLQLHQVKVVSAQPIAEPVSSQPQYMVKSRATASLIDNVQADQPVFKPISPSSPVSRMNSSHPFAADSRPKPEKLNIKSRFELPEAEQLSLPEIKIEGHIYDAEAQTRMVIINGNVRKENQSIAAGLILQEITADGIILNYHGNVFHMGVFDR